MVYYYYCDVIFEGRNIYQKSIFISNKGNI